VNTTTAGTRRIDLGNLLTVSEAIARSAIERKESRGGHCPRRLSRQEPRIREVQHRSRGARRTAPWKSSGVPLPPMPPELQQIIEEQKA
jgi:succinate dehydrogenase / fumarate reductase flavoprotein subunit